MSNGYQPKAHKKSVVDHLKTPPKIPFAISCDIAERTSGLDIKRSAGWFVDLVCARIMDTGKHIDELTVRELREIIEECETASNAAAKRKIYLWRVI